MDLQNIRQNLREDAILLEALTFWAGQGGGSSFRLSEEELGGAFRRLFDYLAQDIDELIPLSGAARGISSPV